MKHFTLGPVAMYPRTLEVGAQQVPYFRTPEFSATTLESEALLTRLTAAPAGARAAFLTASGTGAMEAVVMGALGPEDRALVINGGTFGERFVQLCALHSVPHEVLELHPGEALTPEHLRPYEGIGITALLVNIHETSTGQLYDAAMLSEFCRRNGATFIVDAISSFLADPLPMAELEIDAMILSSQKGLALSPGLSVIMMSRELIKERVAPRPRQTMYFDLMSHLRDGERGQTPFSPAVGIMLELNDMLRAIDEEGLEARLAHIADIASDFRARAVEQHGLTIPAHPLSAACTPLVLEDGGARELFARLRDEHGIYLNPNGGPLADTVIRVGHLGNHTVEENRGLLDAIAAVLGR